MGGGGGAFWESTSSYISSSVAPGWSALPQGKSLWVGILQQKCVGAS